jgi:predicted GNAT family N-acyltransferase
VPNGGYALYTIAAMDELWVVHKVDWYVNRAELQAIRRAVFVVEQHVPEELEWDADDARSQHVLAYAPDGAAIGTGRLLPDGHIGRMAVLKPWRGRGVGSALLMRLLGLALEQRSEYARLHAQTHAVEFYAKHGFTATGDEFMEAGIPHRLMVLRLSQAPK